MGKTTRRRTLSNCTAEAPPTHSPTPTSDPMSTWVSEHGRPKYHVIPSQMRPPPIAAIYSRAPSVAVDSPRLAAVVPTTWLLMMPSQIVLATAPPK
jgi:hypothetical protein